MVNNPLTEQDQLILRVYETRTDKNGKWQQIKNPDGTFGDAEIAYDEKKVQSASRLFKQKAKLRYKDNSDEIIRIFNACFQIPDGDDKDGKWLVL